MTRLPIGVLASGRGSNFQALLEAARDADYPAHVVALLSDVEDAPALEIARANGVDAVHVDPGSRRARLSREAEDRMIAELKDRGVRLVALAGFMRILSPAFLDAFPGFVINIHPSLLPSFPGLHVQRKALEHGVRFSGCTVHFVDEGIDSGPILMQAIVPVLDEDTPEILAGRILKEEHRIYPEAVRLLAENRVIRNGRRCLIRERKEDTVG